MALSFIKLVPSPSLVPCSLTTFRLYNTRRKRDLHQDIEDIPFEAVSREKELKIRTCGEVFARWRAEKRYWSVPKSELEFDVKYIDTGYPIGKEKKSPTVLALHGSPGSYTDFHNISANLYRAGARIIALNFPGSDRLQPKVFRHTPEEKSQYVKDFLKQLRVPSVDMLICHSSALFTGLPLCVDNREVPVNSIALLNPTALQLPKGMQPYWLIHSLIRFCEVPIGFRITNMVGRRLANRPELKGGKFQEHLLSAFVLAHSNIPQQVQPFESLVRRDFPIFLAYSENDKLISKQASQKMAAIMVREEEIEKYDKEAMLQSGGCTNPFRKAMSFSNGSHFLMKTHPGIISDAITSFLLRHFENRIQ